MGIEAEIFEQLRAESAEEGAAFGLFGLMSGISEDCWAAGWLADLEHILWKAACTGEGPVTPRQADLLRLLAEEAGGWWRWDEGRGAVFTPLAEWKAMARDPG